MTAATLILRLLADGRPRTSNDVYNWFKSRGYRVEKATITNNLRLLAMSNQIISDGDNPRVYEGGE